MLLGRYPESRVAPWLTEPQPSRLPDLTFSIRFMDQALAEETAAFDFVHLSNILDWLPQEQAESILDLAWQALRPGGWLIIRQLNSVLEIPNLGPQFNWLSSEANALHAGDRSFFYRALHLGRKQ